MIFGVRVVVFVVAGFSFPFSDLAPTAGKAYSLSFTGPRIKGFTETEVVARLDNGSPGRHSNLHCPLEVGVF